MLNSFINNGELVSPSKLSLSRPDPVHPIKCAADTALVAEDVKSLTTVASTIAADCDKNRSDACKTDLDSFMAAFDALLGHATTALSDCLDGTDSACNDSLTSVVSKLSDVSADVEEVLANCEKGDRKIKDCLGDVKESGEAVVAVVEEAFEAYKACKSE